MANCHFCNGQCSCHISPPCCFCTEHEYCDVCGELCCTRELEEVMDASDGSVLSICPECCEE